MSSGVEPFSVAHCEFGVGASAEFEFSDSCGPYAEVLGCRGEREVLGSSGWSEVGVVGCLGVPSEGAEDFTCDGSFEGSEDFLAGPSFGEARVAVGDGGRVVGHPDLDHVVPGGVGLPVASSAEAMPVGAS